MRAVESEVMISKGSHSNHHHAATGSRLVNLDFYHLSKFHFFEDRLISISVARI